ncbi:MAG: S9 family peptidase [Alphaproteobacteria bacterium]|nr:S9 family peptidase [Alphaproteobacteria bacterium]
MLSLISCVLAVAATSDDPFLWLEDVRGQRALKWVRAQNELTLRSLRSDDGYGEALAAASAIVGAKDRIPYGSLAAGWVHNFWQDERHPRGVWRRTRLSDYRDREPAWEALIDLDALAASQGRDWTWRGAECLPPTFTRCLIRLSRNGDEAIIVREFDIATKSFVRNGFDIGVGRTDVSWVDANTVVVATNWGKGAPRAVKLWNRGEAIGDAKAIYEGKPGDLAVRPVVYSDAKGTAEIFIIRSLAGSDSEVLYVDANSRVTRIDVPRHLDFKGLHSRQVLFQTARDWKVGGATMARGALVGFSLDEYIGNGGIVPAVKVLFTPEPRIAIADVTLGRDAVYLSLLDNVKGRTNEVTYDGQQWFWRRMTLPDTGSVEVVSASPVDAEVLIKFECFVTPDRLYIASKGKVPKIIKSLPDRFDAGAVEVAQYEAVSADGTRIPYFFVRRGARGNTPTLLYAYGGFQVSTTPWYWSTAGKLWLEKGGAYAVANVRGGGEFGPGWHEAATRERRQRNFDDLAAVAKDMIARGFTSPRRLGVIGSSQGGLLATGAFVQNPDLFNAVSAQLPLTDMLRYKRLSTDDANLIAEYGNPDDPRQRAIITRWSPYQNVRVGVTYPRAFFLTATRDERVHPGHARKMAAKLDAFGQPTLYFETPDTAGTRAEQLALTFTYFRQQLMD